MKHCTRLLSLLVVVAVFALALSAHAASNPIANSLHNMNNVFGPGTIQDNQICLPCHSPHSQPDPTVGTLWNHVMPSSNYTLYGTGSNYVGLDSASRMCLSCHDGTVAIDSYGSGGSVHTGTIKLGAANDINGNSTAGFVVGGGGDLTHDHPVGLTYPGLSADGKTWTTSSGFKDPTKFTSKSYYTSTQNPDGSYVTASYVNDSGASISAVGGSVISLQNGNVIGCVACHTPHNNEYNFLHIPNTNSQLCLTCHDR